MIAFVALASFLTGALTSRDALRDAYEEALDLACYLKQAIVERDATR